MAAYAFPFPSPPVNLRGSVGAGGANRAADVEIVQALLNAHTTMPGMWVDCDRKCGPATRGRIEAFQISVAKMRRADGRIDPGGRSLRLLNSPASGAIDFVSTGGSVSAHGNGHGNTSVTLPTGNLSTGMSAALQQLLAHIREREGTYSYFYCDSVGLVTIGIGHLVDQRGGSDRVGQRLAKGLKVIAGVSFRNHGRAATDQEVADDWLRVKRHGRSHRNASARSYANVAQLRLPEVGVLALLRNKVGRYIQALHRKKPFLVRLDPRITMAIVDVRYNPAGISPWGSNPQVVNMYKALDPDHVDFNLREAARLFERIWGHRATARYQERHRIRASWFHAGVEAMLSTTN